MPIRTQFHHSRPVYLQNRLYGRIVYPADFWVCGLCHDAIHEILDWLLKEGRRPSPMPAINTKMYQAALSTYNWYMSEIVRLGRGGEVPKV
jgi:hypothetical protein